MKFLLYLIDFFVIILSVGIAGLTGVVAFLLLKRKCPSLTKAGSNQHSRTFAGIQNEYQQNSGSAG